MVDVRGEVLRPPHGTYLAKYVNCGKDQLSRSSESEVWKKEKEIMQLKVTKNLTYPEARKSLRSAAT